MHRGRNNSSKVPVTIRYGLPLLVVGLLAWKAYQWWDSGLSTLAFVDPAGNQLMLEGATVELFDYDDSPSAKWPLARRGEPMSVSGADLVLSDLPGPTIVRIDTPTFGIGFGYAEPGQRRSTVEIGPPLPIRVRVTGGPEHAPLGGARVQVLGGGPRGVELFDAVSADDGTLVVDRIWGTIKTLCFRAFASGHAVAEVDTFVDPVSEVALELELSRPVEGRVTLGVGAAEVPRDGLTIRAFHVPGVGAAVAADGSFTIDHLPPPPRQIPLLVAGLPEGLTHRRTQVVAGELRADVEVVAAVPVSGRVVNGHTGAGVAECRVYHDHGPEGMEVAVTDATGAFTLRQVPPGPVHVHALIRVARKSLSAVAARRHPGDMRFVDVEGDVRLVVVPDQPQTDLLIEVW